MMSLTALERPAKSSVSLACPMKSRNLEPGRVGLQWIVTFLLPSGASRSNSMLLAGVYPRNDLTTETPSRTTCPQLRVERLSSGRVGVCVLRLFSSVPGQPETAGRSRTCKEVRHDRAYITGAGRPPGSVYRDD